VGAENKKLPEQLKRLGVIVGLFLIVVIVRFFILPEWLISARPHQAAKVVREMAKPMHYAGMASCRECHQEQYDAKAKGYHRGIGCENCHGPSAEHAAHKDDKTLMPRKPREREFCLACHGYLASRPNGFPQVDGQKHNPRKRCAGCHDPHDPAPSEPPQDCGGCHGRIAQLKAISTHALVPCAECHKVEPQHMIDPRSALPSKPDSRQACGRCHDVGSTDPAASKSRVDLSSHGRAYVCWECHYAHLPEGPK